MTTHKTDADPVELSTPAVSDTVDTEQLDGHVLDGLEPIAVGTPRGVGPARTATVVATDEPGIPGLAAFLDEANSGDVLVSVGTRLDRHRCSVASRGHGPRRVAAARSSSTAGPRRSRARGRPVGRLGTSADTEKRQDSARRHADRGTRHRARRRHPVRRPGRRRLERRRGRRGNGRGRRGSRCTRLERLDDEFERALHDGAGFGRAHRQTGTM